jgi:hypothetical protein
MASGKPWNALWLAMAAYMVLVLEYIVQVNDFLDNIFIKTVPCHSFHCNEQFMYSLAA